MSAALAEAASLDEQLKAASTAYDAKLTSQRTELMNEMEAASSSAAARIANLDSLNVHLKAELHELANSSAMQACTRAWWYSPTIVLLVCLPATPCRWPFALLGCC